MKINQRIKVQIKDPDRYVFRCAESLDGKKGVITKFQCRDNDYKDSRYLIKFDTPAETWWEHQLPVYEYWVETEDVIEWHYK